MYQEIFRKDNSLRPYQQKAKEDIFTAWDECDNIMFQMPTGTGKTRLFSSIISDIKTWGVQHSEDVKILIIAHRIELIDQISENLERYKVSHGVIAGGKARRHLGGFVVLPVARILARKRLVKIRRLVVKLRQALDRVRNRKSGRKYRNVPGSEAVARTHQG